MYSTAKPEAKDGKKPLPTSFPYRQDSTVTNKTNQRVGKDAVVNDKKKRAMFSTQAGSTTSHTSKEPLPTAFPYRQDSTVTNKHQRRIGKDAVVADKKHRSMFSTQAGSATNDASKDGKKPLPTSFPYRQDSTVTNKTNERVGKDAVVNDKKKRSY